MTSSSQQRRTLSVASSGTLLALVAFVTPQATVVRTVVDLEAGTSGTPWLLSAMPLGLAVALLPAGALADDRGRRRVFVIGLASLVVGAVLCAAAPTTAVFIAGRVVQGVGAAAVLACGLGLIGTVFPPGPGRTRATGVWGACIGGGIAVGGLLPVLVDRGDDWRYSYVTTAVLALAVAVAARLTVQESRAPRRRPADLAGAALLAAGLGCLLGGLIESRSGGALPATALLGIAAAVLLTAFVGVETRRAAPMLDVTLFRHRPFLAATTGAVANGAGATALVSYLPTVLQVGLGASLLTASLCTLLFAGVSIATALATRRLPTRWSGRGLMAGSLVGLAAGQLALIGLTPTSRTSQLLPGLLLGGLAYGVLNAALGREAVASVPEGRASVGSGANNTARYTASAFGVTLVALVADPTTGPQALTAGWNTAVLVTTGMSMLGAVTIAALRPARR